MIFNKKKTLSLFFIFTAFLISSFANATQLSSKIEKKFAALESYTDGRIGISAINIGNNQHIEYRASERFPFCSTSKVIGVAAILKNSMIDSQYLRQKIFYNKESLVVSSPITEKHLADGMTISDLCDATIRYSDNTAINLLIKKLGGLNTVNTFARSIGDETFRLDRWEPELNTAIPGDIRDTTTPLAMTQDLQKIIFTPFLASKERDLLLRWLRYNTTGNNRIRAGVPNDWIVGDKTGTGVYGTTNDIGVILPHKCSPIVVTIYYTQNKKDSPHRDEVIAKATKILVDAFAENDACINSSLIKRPSVSELSTIRRTQNNDLNMQHLF